MILETVDGSRRGNTDNTKTNDQWNLKPRVMKFPVHHSISQIIHHSILHLTRQNITVNHNSTSQYITNSKNSV